MYYRGAAAVILVFDVSDASTLEKVHEWVVELQNHAPHAGGAIAPVGGDPTSEPHDEPTLLFVAANKADLRYSPPPGAEFVDTAAAQCYASTLRQPSHSTLRAAFDGGPLLTPASCIVLRLCDTMLLLS